MSLPNRLDTAAGHSRLAERLLDLAAPVIALLDALMPVLVALLAGGRV